MKSYSFIAYILFIFLCSLYIAQVNLKEIDGRIVSGTQAVEGQLPWQVIIKKDEYDTLWCGGSVISNYWVLTAAHCTYGLTSVLLLFGTIHLLDSTNNMTANELFIHPQYIPDSLANDISLIHLPTALNFTKTLRPIILTSASEDSQGFVGSAAIIAGFGITDDEYLEYSNTLLWAKVEIIKNSDCANVYGKHIIQGTNICSKGEGKPNTSICSGDSGGALIAILNNIPVQIGINSFVAEDRCTEGYPSVYVRLSSYLNYVSSVTGIPFT